MKYGKGRCYFDGLMSLPVRGAWVEIKPKQYRGACRPSLPVRGAWVEMPRCEFVLWGRGVAPRAGSVG